MLLQNTAMVAKKSLVNDKISPCVTQICLLGVTCKVSNSKTLSGETLCILEKRLLSIFEFCDYLIVFFYDLLIGPQPTFLDYIVIFL